MDLKSINLPLFFGGLSSFIIGLILSSFLLGMIVHENSHVLACLVFGLQIESYSLSYVTYVVSPNVLVNIIVRLAGGIGQALVSLLFFWNIVNLEGRAFRKTFFENLFNNKNPPILGPVFGLELAFLTIAFHGIVNAIWEGFFFENYELLHDNTILWGLIILGSTIVSIFILKKRYQILITPKEQSI